jgi:hypothetical protein
MTPSLVSQHRTLYTIASISASDYFIHLCPSSPRNCGNGCPEGRMIRHPPLWSARTRSMYVTDNCTEHSPHAPVLRMKYTWMRRRTPILTSFSKRSRLYDHWQSSTTSRKILIVRYFRFCLLCHVLIAEAVYILTFSDSEASILSTETETIKGLTKVLRSAKVVRQAADVPAGCGSSLLSADSALHIDVAVGLPCHPEVSSHALPIIPLTFDEH